MGFITIYFHSMAMRVVKQKIQTTIKLERVEHVKIRAISKIFIKGKLPIKAEQLYFIDFLNPLIYVYEFTKMIEVKT